MYIQIEPNADGSHDYQIGGALENGWAVIPADMVLPGSFPYVDIVVDEVTNEVTSMTERGIPEAPEPEAPEPEAPSVDNSSVWDELDAAYQSGYDEGYTEGVNSAYDQ